MKRFKKRDTWLSLALIIVCTSFSLLYPGYAFIYSYFIVGAWQLTSLAIHFYHDWFTDDKPRQKYQRTVISLITIFLFFLLLYGLLLHINNELLQGLFSMLALIFMCSLLFITPAMAIIYTWICYQEAYVKMRRPLSLLK